MEKIFVICISVFLGMQMASVANAEEASFWDKAKESADGAVEWTKDKSKDGWEATKDGADEAVDWSKEKSKEGWEASKDLLD